MKLIYKLIILSTLFFFYNLSVKAETFFLDFKYILNESDAGKKANKFLKDELDKNLKNLKNKETQLQKEEKEIIQKKKVLSPEEYKKQITNLRKKVLSLQKERNTSLESISTKRNKARNELLAALNPIVKNYMSEKNIKIVLDKKSILLADEKLDITKDIINLLNKQIKSLNIK